MRTDKKIDKYLVKEDIDSVVKYLSKEGWGTTNEKNILNKIKEIVYEYKKMEKQLDEIRKAINR